jgi:phosphoserine phosphatase
MTSAEAVDRLDDLYKVLEITRAMAAVEDLKGLMRLIIDRSMELLGAERATVFLYDAQTNELVSVVAAGMDELRAPADRGISGATIRAGRTVNVPDVYADPRFNPDIDRMTGFRTRNMISLPLRGYDGGLVGLLQVINKQEGTFDEYDVTLAETLAAQAGVAIQRAELMDHFVRKQEMDRAMRIAQQIQRDLLPAAEPDVKGFEVAGVSLPADETGGDAYDYLQVAKDRWMFAVADASGHGIGSALVVAETRAMLRAVSLLGGDVSAVLRTANRLLTADLGESRFVTCFLGLLDAERSILEYASAGHGPLIFYDRASDAFSQRIATDLPLGVTGDQDYRKVVSHPFGPGDFVAITTDGFAESTNPAGQEFGLQRLLRVLWDCREGSAQLIVDKMVGAVRDFTRGQRPHDDLTALIIRRH